MYPCSGLDVPDVVQTFGDLFDTFLFVDIRYDFSRLNTPPVSGWEEVPGTRRLEGKPADHVRHLQSGRRHFRHVEPAWLRADYLHLRSGRTIEICLRRGFGQYALQELTDGTMGMFLHRGDSSGEGGSGVMYLANRRLSHPPLSMLFDAIKQKLTMPALIASDGSNTRIRELSLAGGGDDSITTFTRFGLLWQRNMNIARPGDRRITVVWSVSLCDPCGRAVSG